MVDFARARRTMVDNQLRTNGITDLRLLAVMGEVPRERFVPEGRRDLAYIDADLPLGVRGRAMPAPAPFARLVQLAGIGPQDTVLDLGCATGYSTAVLARLGRSVVGVEPEPALAAEAEANLATLGCTNAEVRTAPIDGTGVGGGPFDVVLIEAAVPAVPAAVWPHLRDRGRLVALLGSGMTAVAHLFVKIGDDIAGRPDFNARLPSIGRANEARDFVF
jgi:protein-L-isoaspartate(D-aspartate) O-methyltransferase